MQATSVLQVMSQIRDLLAYQADIWTLEMFCTYTGFEKSYVYKMTSQKKLRHYKTPGGKKIFFKREDVIAFLTSNTILSRQELDIEAKKIIKRNI